MSNIDRVIVAGSREFNDIEYIREALIKLVNDGFMNSHPVFISGDARGPDKIAIELAKEWNLVCEIYPAMWQDYSEPCKIRTNQYGKYNSLAGMKRNKQMANVATHLIAFWDGISSGTSDMIQEMMNQNKKVMIVYV